MGNLIFPVVNIIPATIVANPGDGSAYIVVRLAGGVLDHGRGAALVSQPLQWQKSPGVDANAYQVMMQTVSGTWFGNLRDTWLSLGSIPAPTWGCNGSPTSASGILHIRRGGSGGPLVSAPFNFQVL